MDNDDELNSQTTIIVRKRTSKLLREVKEANDFDSIDQTLNEMVKQINQIGNQAQSIQNQMEVKTDGNNNESRG